MFDFLGNRIQKSIQKMSKKTTLNEADILEVIKDIKFALLEADVNLLVVKKFIKDVKEKALESELIGKLNPSQTMIKIVKDELTTLLGGKAQEIKIVKKPHVIMFVGLQGGGKTTTVAKVAYYLRKKKFVENPLLVACDVYRPAAIDQLQTLAKQIQIPVYANDVSVSPIKTARQALDQAYKEKNDLVIIDTAGRLSIDEKLMEELLLIKKEIKPDEIIFVADAMSGQDIINVAKTFHEKLSLSSSIITKLDSDARGGAALSIREILNIPIKFIGTGEKISNIDIFHADRMAERILGMGDVLSLIEKTEEVVDKNKVKKMMNRMIKGNFDLEDLMENLKQVQKMGKLSKIVKMIPGLGGKIDDSKLDQAESKIRLFTILISSMTSEEKKNPKLLKNASRKRRIIEGSGRSVQEYNLLVNEFETMTKKMKALSANLKEGKITPGSFGNFSI